MKTSVPKPRKTDVERPSFSKHPWSDGIRFDYDTVQNSANCYCYACNDPKGHGAFGPGRPRPGERAGIELKPGRNDKADIVDAAVADGLIKAPDDNPPEVKGYYLVALAMWEKGGDIHWYRQDADGTWSHKMGNKEPKSEDESGNKITDVKTADRGKYTEFGGYFYVPNEGIKIGKKGKFLHDEEMKKRQEEAKDKIRQAKDKTPDGDIVRKKAALTASGGR